MEDDGAWFRDEYQWRNCIEKLYDQLIGEYESGSSVSRLRRSAGHTYVPTHTSAYHPLSSIIYRIYVAGVLFVFSTLIPSGHSLDVVSPPFRAGLLYVESLRLCCKEWSLC